MLPGTLTAVLFLVLRVLSCTKSFFFLMAVAGVGSDHFGLAGVEGLVRPRWLEPVGVGLGSDDEAWMAGRLAGVMAEVVAAVAGVAGSSEGFRRSEAALGDSAAVISFSVTLNVKLEFLTTLELPPRPILSKPSPPFPEESNKEQDSNFFSTNPIIPYDLKENNLHLELLEDFLGS